MQPLHKVSPSMGRSGGRVSMNSDDETGTSQMSRTARTGRSRHATEGSVSIPAREEGGDNEAWVREVGDIMSSSSSEVFTDAWAAVPLADRRVYNDTMRVQYRNVARKLAKASPAKRAAYFERLEPSSFQHLRELMEEELGKAAQACDDDDDDDDDDDGSKGFERDIADLSRKHGFGGGQRSTGMNTDSGHMGNMLPHSKVVLPPIRQSPDKSGDDGNQMTATASAVAICRQLREKSGQARMSTNAVKIAKWCQDLEAYLKQAEMRNVDAASLTSLTHRVETEIAQILAVQDSYTSSEKLALFLGSAQGKAILEFGAQSIQAALDLFECKNPQPPRAHAAENDLQVVKVELGRLTVNPTADQELANSYLGGPSASAEANKAGRQQRLSPDGGPSSPQPGMAFSPGAPRFPAAASSNGKRLEFNAEGSSRSKEDYHDKHAAYNRHIASDFILR